MKFSSSLFVLSSLCLFANSQDSSYPNCIPTACASLQKISKTACDYDLANAYATVDQTKCICQQSGIQIPIQQCFDCLRLSSDPAEADYFRDICPPDTIGDSGKSASVTPGSLTASAGTATGSVTLTSQTMSTDTTSMPSSSAQSTISSSSSSGQPSIDIPRETPTSTGAASHITPVIGLAAVLLVAQVGL